MIVAVVVSGIGVAAGAAATVAAWRWSAADPTDPHVERRTVRRFIRDHPLVQRLVRRYHPDPGVAAAEALGVAAVGVAAAAVVTGALLIMIRTRTGLARADIPFAEWAADNATEASNEFLRTVSEFGGTALVVVGALGVTLFELRRDRRWAVPAFVAITVGGQFLLSNGIKFVVDRARPTLSPLTGFAGTSFPSGHAVAAAATWACVAFMLGRRRNRHVRSVLLGAAVAIAVAVAATRVALGVHWTTDVIAGLVIGWAWFALCSIAFGGRVLHLGEPVAIAEAAADDVPAPRPAR
jgi:membrane-associated phospholipid phosphatase